MVVPLGICICFCDAHMCVKGHGVWHKCIHTVHMCLASSSAYAYGTEFLSVLGFGLLYEGYKSEYQNSPFYNFP